MLRKPAKEKNRLISMSKKFPPIYGPFSNMDECSAGQMTDSLAVFLTLNTVMLSLVYIKLSSTTGWN